MGEFSINGFRSALKFGGARNTLFKVNMSFPAGIGGDAGRDIEMFAKAATLPPTEHGVINVPHYGRSIKVNGDKNYGAWQITIINDEDFKFRHAFEQWMFNMQTTESNIATALAAVPAQYKVDAQITQYAKAQKKVLRVYNFSGIFPVQVSAINMDWGAQNTIEDFTVVLEYDYHEVVDGSTGRIQG